VPDDPEWIAQFMGAIWRMSLQTHYEREPTHSAILVAAKWREIWEDLQVSGCCNGGADQNINVYNTLIQTNIFLEVLHQAWVLALFDVTVAFFGVPAEFDADPGDAGAEIAQRNRALCLATRSYIDQLMNQAMQWIEDSVPGVTTIGIGAMLIPSVPMWITGAGFAAVALGLSKLYEQASDKAYREYLACGMFNELLGKGINDTAAFAASLDNLPIRPPPPETIDQNLARDALEIWARSVTNNVDNYLAFVKQLDVAMGVAAELTDEDCPCLASWEQLFDFTLGELAWVTDPRDGSGWGATHVPGVGWQNSGVGAQKSLGIKLTVMTEDGNFDEVKMTYVLGTALLRQATIQTILVSDTTSDDITPAGTFVPFDGNYSFSTQTLHALILSAGAGSSHVLESITFKGVGNNPFIL